MLALARGVVGRRCPRSLQTTASSIHAAAGAATAASSSRATAAPAGRPAAAAAPAAALCAARRPFSSSAGGGGSGFPIDDVLGAPTTRGAADPDFAVFGDDCLLKFRLSTYVAPGAAGMYKSNNARLLLEFTRKNAGGVYDWRSTKRLSMTPEEIGLLLDSHPTEELIFKRSGMVPPGAAGGQQGGPPKEIKFIPTQHGDWVIVLEVDDEKYQVTVTRGRKAVIKSLIHSALPAIFGWGKVTGAGHGGQAHYYHEDKGHYSSGGGVPF